MKNRITYRNLGEIFVMEIEDENIEVGTIDYYMYPFNKYVVIKNIYKYPERVKEYAEACQFTNAQGLVNKAPLLRTLAPISNVIGAVVVPALNESFKRNIILPPSAISYTEFSYYDPQSIEYHKYHEPHIDLPNNLPINSVFPHIHPRSELPSFTLHGSKVLANGLHFDGAETMAGVLFLDETFGTEILVNTNISYYRSKTSETWGSPAYIPMNDNYYPEGTDSHYEHKITIGGEYNSAAFYYGAVLHRPHYSGASEDDLKRGRLIQNIWMDDITEN